MSRKNNNKKNIMNNEVDSSPIENLLKDENEREVDSIWAVKMIKSLMNSENEEDINPAWAVKLVKSLNISSDPGGIENDVNPAWAIKLIKAWNITLRSDMDDYSKRNFALDLFYNHRHDCPCMVKNIILFKSHPEWFFPDSPMNPCIGCGKWEKASLEHRCEKCLQ